MYAWSLIIVLLHALTSNSHAYKKMANSSYLFRILRSQKQVSITYGLGDWVIHQSHLKCKTKDQYSCTNQPMFPLVRYHWQITGWKLGQTARRNMSQTIS